MEDKLPHYTTLQKFGTRSEVLKIADSMIAQIGQAADGGGGGGGCDRDGIQLRGHAIWKTWKISWHAVALEGGSYTFIKSRGICAARAFWRQGDKIRLER